MFNAAFTPTVISANSSRPEISPQTTPEVLTALDSLRRVGEYNQRAKESRQFLCETLKNGGVVVAERRKSVDVGMAPVAQMGGGVAEGGKKMLGAPTASMVNAPFTAPASAPASVSLPAPLPAPLAAQTFPYTTTTSNIDASRDPRRR
jgi:hypothetical protein